MIIGVVAVGLVAYTVVIWLWGCLPTLLIYQLTGDVQKFKLRFSGEEDVGGDLGLDYESGFAFASRTGQTVKVRSASPNDLRKTQISPHVSPSMLPNRKM